MVELYEKLKAEDADIAAILLEELKKIIDELIAYVKGVLEIA